MKLEFSRKVANGNLYICPECGAEMLLYDPIVAYCSDCGAEFYEDDETDLSNTDLSNKEEF